MTRIEAVLRWTIALALSLEAGAAAAQEIGQPEKGLAFARQICAECHAVEKEQTRSPNAAAPRFEAIANIPGMTGLALTATLQTPHRSMPNLILDSDQLRDVIAYILSLKRSN